jgi:hypothetical protein
VELSNRYIFSAMNFFSKLFQSKSASVEPPQIERIKEKLKLLKKLDPGYSVFGASAHSYVLKRSLSIDDIQRFEKDNSIKLPIEYVQFLTMIGNGGAGPFYGVEPLENCLYQDLDYKRPGELLIPSRPFIHTSAWNMEFEPTVDDEDDEDEYESQRKSFDEEYYDPKHINGTIAICNYGCAVTLYLIVNGNEYGNIWIDDRASDQGIRPSEELGNSGRITFLDWYEKWLDNSIAAVKNPV